MIRDPLALWALVGGSTWLAFELERRVVALRKVGASLIAILLGAFLSNTGLVPNESEVYGTIIGTATSLAIAWLLLSVNLVEVKKAGPRMIAAFGLAVVGTATGAVVGALVFGGFFGDDAWRLAGTLTGTYSGGSLNFVAVGRALELPDRLFAGATAADNVTTAIWFATTLSSPIWLGWLFRGIRNPLLDAENAVASDGVGVAAGGEPHDAEAAAREHPFFRTRPLSTLTIGRVVAVGLILLWASEALGAAVPVVPSVVWLTTLALIVGHLPKVGDLPGSMELGNLALHFFFVVIGIFSKISEIASVGFQVFWYTLLVVLVHGVVVFGVGRLVRLDLPSLSVASQAAVGGPSTALAQAVSRRWGPLVLPGILVGLLGYAVGNYAGLMVAALLR